MASLVLALALTIKDAAASPVATVVGGKNLSLTTAGGEFFGEIREVTTTGGLLALGSITGTPVFILIVNLDATNFLQFSYDAAFTQIFAKIPAGYPILLPPNSNTVYLRANTATVRAFVAASEA